MFAELVCGPPGSGKTTYCEGKRQFLSVYDPLRPVVLFNLDPANDSVLPYPCDVSICELITVQDAMAAAGLGPNGSYLYCSQYIHEQIDWVKAQIISHVARKEDEVRTTIIGGGSAAAGSAGSSSANATPRAPYLIIDCPGQVEFYLHSDMMQRLIKMLQKQLQCEVCMVHLTDAQIATRDVPTYVSSTLLSLSVMIDLELPHVNVLSKWDTLPPPETILAAPTLKPQQTPSPSTTRHRHHNSNGRNSSDRNDDMTSSSGFVADDHYDVFLRPGEFFREHLGRMWQLLDRRTYHDERASTGAASETNENATNEVEEEKHGEKGQQPQCDENSASASASTSPAPHYTRSRLYRLSHKVMDVVEGYGMVGYVPLAVQDQRMMLFLTQQIDNAMGNLFA